jgi:hypothetical protein
MQWKPNPTAPRAASRSASAIDELVDDLLEEADPTGRLQVDVRGLEEADLPIVGAGEVRGSRAASRSTRTRPTGTSSTRSRSATASSRTSTARRRADAPEDDHRQGHHDIKVLTWGKNLEHLTLERELGKEQAPTIVVKAYDPVTRRRSPSSTPTASSTTEREKHVSQTKVRGTQIRAKTTENTRRRPRREEEGRRRRRSASATSTRS